MEPRPHRVLAAVFGFAAAVAGPSQAPAVERELYFTDFEEAPVGDDQLVGFDSWNGNSTGRGAHGIDAEAVQGLGQSAFIGFGNPGFAATSVTVLRPVSHDPTGTGEPIVRLIAALGVNDSSNAPIPGAEPLRDQFFVSFFDGAGQRLASLDFNNTEVAFGLWRDDGVETHDTTEEFIRGEVQLLVAEIDFENNTWTVELDGFPIFRDAEFTARADVAMTLGAAGIVWQRGGLTWGNNWMLFDDWTVTADTVKAVIPEDPFVLRGVERDAQNCVVLTWKAQPGFSYQVEYSDDGATWKSDLPDSTKTETSEIDTSFTDPDSAAMPTRLYRVVRNPAG